jgi:integrase
MADIRVSDALAYKAQLLKKPIVGRDGRPKVGLEPSFVNLRLASMRFLCKVAKREGIRTDNPFDSEFVDRVKKVGRGRYAPTGPEFDQAQLVIDSIDGSRYCDERDRMLLLVLLRMGLRRAEVVELRADSFAQDREGWSVELLRKGGIVQRVLLPLVLEDPIKTYVEKWNLSGFLFVVSSDRTGKAPGELPLTPGAVYQIVRKHSKAALGAAVPTHALRHTFITESLDSGAPLAIVQRYSGHRDPRTTSLYYDDRLKRETCAADFLDRQD